MDLIDLNKKLSILIGKTPTKTTAYRDQSNNNNFFINIDYVSENPHTFTVYIKNADGVIPPQDKIINEEILSTNLVETLSKTSVDVRQYRIEIITKTNSWIFAIYRFFGSKNINHIEISFFDAGYAH